MELVGQTWCIYL